MINIKNPPLGGFLIVDKSRQSINKNLTDFVFCGIMEEIINNYEFRRLYVGAK